MTRPLVVITALALAFAGMTTPAAAYSPPGATQRVSAAADAAGMPVSDNVPNGAISGAGRVVAYHSAGALVAGDTNGKTDVYVRDLGTGALERVSVASDGGEANGASTNASVSQDGRHVAFQSGASNLVPGDTNGAIDILVRDRVARTTTLASVASDGTLSDGTSVRPSLSDDGQVVAFESGATTLVAGDANEASDVFVRDLAAGTTELGTVTTDGRQGSIGVNSLSPSLSGNGRFVIFVARFPYALGSGEQNPQDDVFVRDRLAGTTEIVSVGSDGGAANGNSFFPSISDDGRMVAFGSFASSLVPNDRGGAPGAYVRDRLAGVTERITTPDGAELNAIFGSPLLSGDGRFLTGNVLTTNFGVASDDNGTTDIYVVDLADRSVELVSATPAGAAGNSASTVPSISDDGRLLTFASEATDLVRDGVTGGHVYLRDRGPALGIARLHAEPHAGGVTVTGAARFAGVPVVVTPDPSTDGAAVPGGELRGMSVTLRTEAEDLLFRADWVAGPRIPSRPSLAGTSAERPGALTYGFTFRVDGVGHEVRATPRAGTAGPRYELLRCEGACTAITPLRGGVGTLGDAVIVAVPLGALGAGSGTRLERLGAYVAAGADAAGPVTVLDGVAEATAVVPAATVEVAVAPAGTPASAVAFEPVTVTGGRFTVDLAGAGAGQQVWARACIGTACATRTSAT